MIDFWLGSYEVLNKDLRVTRVGVRFVEKVTQKENVGMGEKWG